MRECNYYEELISRLVDSELNKTEYAALEAHLKTCSRCNAMYAVFSALSEVVSDEAAEVPAGLHESIMADVRRSAMAKRNRRRLSKPVQASLAAAACAAFVLFAARGILADNKAETVVIRSSDAGTVIPAAEKPAPVIVAAEDSAASEAAAVIPTPTPAAVPKQNNTQTQQVQQTQQTQRDIYLESAPEQTVKPTAAHNQPQQPIVQLSPKEKTERESGLVLGTEDAQTPAASVEVSEEPVEKKNTSAQEAAPAAETAELENNAAPVGDETPSLFGKVKSFFSVAAPKSAAEAPMMMAAPAPEEESAAPAEAEEASEPAEAEPTEELAQEPDAPEEAAVIAGPECSAEPEDEVKPVKAGVQQGSELERLMKLLSGKVDKLPEKGVRAVYEIVVQTEDSAQPSATPEPTSTPEPSATPDVTVTFELSGTPLMIPTPSPEVSPDGDGENEEDDGIDLGKILDLKNIKDEKRFLIFCCDKDVYYILREKPEEQSKVFLAKAHTEELERFIRSYILPEPTPSPSPDVSPVTGA